MTDLSGHFWGQPEPNPKFEDFHAQGTDNGPYTGGDTGEVVEFALESHGIGWVTAGTIVRRHRGKHRGLGVGATNR